MAAAAPRRPSSAVDLSQTASLMGYPSGISHRAFTVIYEVNGAEFCRYRVSALAADDAQDQTDDMFRREHPEIDLFVANPGLEVWVDPTR
jgi:hypothetical protein